MIQSYQRLEKKLDDFDKQLEAKEIATSFVTQDENHFAIWKLAYQSKGTCDQLVKEGELAFQCFTCGIVDGHLICANCFKPESHIGHQCTPQLLSGYCDCGNDQILKGEPCNHQDEENQEENDNQQNLIIPQDLKLNLNNFIITAIQLYKKLNIQIEQQKSIHEITLLRLYHFSINQKIKSLKQNIESKINIASYYYLLRKSRFLQDIIVVFFSWLTLKRPIFQRFLEDTLQLINPDSNQTFYEDLLYSNAIFTPLKFLEGNTFEHILLYLRDPNFLKFTSQKQFAKYQNQWYFQKTTITTNGVLIIETLNQLEKLEGEDQILSEQSLKGLMTLTDQFWIQLNQSQLTSLEIISSEICKSTTNYQWNQINLQELFSCCESSQVFKMIQKTYCAIHTPNFLVNRLDYEQLTCINVLFSLPEFDQYSFIQLKDSLGNQFQNFLQGKVKNIVYKNFQMNDFVITILIQSLSEAKPVGLDSFRGNFEMIEAEKNDILNYFKFQEFAISTTNLGIKQLFQSEKCTNNFKENFIELLLVKCYNFIKLKRNIQTSVEEEMKIASQQYFYQNKYNSQQVYEFRKIFLHLMKNATCLDKIFINLLSLHYCQKEYINSGDFRQHLQNLFEDSIDIIRENFSKILQRCVQNYVSAFYPIEYEVIQQYYGIDNGDIAKLKFESFDLAFGKLYIFLFDAFGLQDVNQAFKIVSLPTQVNNLELSYSYLLRILTSDQDIFNLCITFFVDDEQLPNILQDTLAKFLANIMNCQKYLQYSTIENRFKKLGIMSPYHLKNHIFTICYFNEQTKKLALLPQFETIYDQALYKNSGETKQIVINNLEAQQKSSRVLIFGNGLEWDLSKFHNNNYQPMRKLVLFICSNFQYIFQNLQLFLQNNIQNEDILILLHYQLVAASYFRIQELNTNSQSILQNLLQIQKVRQINEFIPIYDQLIQMVRNQSFRKEFQFKQQDPIFRSQNSKKQEKVKLKFKAKIEQVNQKLNLQQSPIETCDYCHTEIEAQQYQLIPIFINFRKNQSIFNYVPEEFNFKSNKDDNSYISVTGCNHRFHGVCFQSAAETFFNSQLEDFPDWYKKACLICNKSFNLLVPLNQQITANDLKSFNDTLTFIIKQAENELELEKLNQLHENNQASVLLEIYFLIIFDLLSQLIIDSQRFIFLNHQIILKQVLKLLFCFGETIQQNKIELEFPMLTSDSLLYRLINSINAFIFQQKEKAKFEEEITTIILDIGKFYSQNLANILFQCFEISQQNIEISLNQINKLNNDALIDYFGNLKQIIYEGLMNKLGKNFLEFHSKYFHQCCQVCGFYNQDFDFSNDVLVCLLCQKNFCAYSCTENDSEFGNLNIHAYNDHAGGSIYISLLTGAITFVQFPFAVYESKLLFYHKKHGHRIQIGKAEEKWKEVVIDENKIKYLVNLLLENDLQTEITASQVRDGQLTYSGEL